MAVGDFNGDGFDDLAVGAPNHDEVDRDIGRVSVFYGSSWRLVTWPYVESCRIPFYVIQNNMSRGTSEAYDLFGWSLAAGDFDNNGCDDLAVGVPHEDIGSTTDAGIVQILYGSSCTGLTTSGYQTWHQDISGIEGGVEKYDLFGWSLAVGDFDNALGTQIPAYDDLAVGIPYEDIGSIANAGMVQILYGASTGLTNRDQVWHQDTSGIQGTCESNDLFGHSLAVGNFDGGPDDLAIGIPYEDLGNITNAGKVQILYSTHGTGLTNRDQILDQNNIGGSAEAWDCFGWSLATGHLDNWSGEELVVGVPYEDLGGITNAGVVHVLYASNYNGNTSFKNQTWHQDSYGVVDNAQPQERFGYALAVGRIKARPYLDLAVGVPGELLYPTGGLPGQGMVNVLYNDR